MEVKRKRIDRKIERNIAIAAIISKEFMKSFSLIYDSELLSVPYARIVVGWCNDYFNKYETVPVRDIESLFEEHSESLPDDDKTDLREFLSSLNNQYERAEKFNAPYVLDQAVKYFKVRSLELTIEETQYHLSQGDLPSAEQTFQEHTTVESIKSLAVDVFKDPGVLRKAFESLTKSILFELPGAIGKYIGPITRDSFIGVMAPEKRGKSFWLWELAWWALRARCNVALFVVGDMSEEQYMLRIASHRTGKNPSRWGRTIRTPIADCLYNQNNECKREERPQDWGILEEEEGKIVQLSFEDAEGYKPCSLCRKDYPQDYKWAIWWIEEKVERLEIDEAQKAFDQVSRRFRGREFKLWTLPTWSINIKGIQALLDQAESSSGFIPDVVVIDYADNLDAEDSVSEKRLQVDKTWGELRALSQNRKIAVITATQADGTSYMEESLGPQHYSEGKRKYSHVTAILTLNQTSKEKRSGIMRMGKMFVREDDFDFIKEITILQRLEKGRPLLDSFE